MISMPGPFVLSLSKASPELAEGGEQKVFPQPVRSLRPYVFESSSLLNLIESPRVAAEYCGFLLIG